MTLVVSSSFLYSNSVVEFDFDSIHHVHRPGALLFLCIGTWLVYSMEKWLVKFTVDSKDKREKENVACTVNSDINVPDNSATTDCLADVTSGSTTIDVPIKVNEQCIKALGVQESILTYVVPKETSRFKSPLLLHNLNPVIYSRPFPRIESRKGLSYYLASRLEVLHSINLQKTVCTGRYSTMTGTSVIKFDHQNELFAVGGRNGVVRIFHIDDCHKMLQFKCDDLILPVARVKTSSVNISEIKWSILDSYCIAISFFSSTQIEIFDLQDEGDPIYDAAYIVDASKSSNAEGYNTFLIVEESLRVNDTPFIVAGSTAGFIRMWSDYGKKRRSTPTWDVLADPQIPASKASPVVGLHVVNDGNVAYLMCFNRVGIVCIWDYKDMKFLPMSSSKSPTLLKRFSVWDQSVPLHHRYQLRGLSLPCVKDNNLLALTVDSGDILLLDISKSLQFSMAQTSAIAGIKMHGNKLDEVDGDETSANANNSALLYCRELTVFPFSPDNYISCTSRHGTNFLEVVDHFSNKCNKNMYTQSYKNYKRESTENQYLQKSHKASYTLPGRVINAERGHCQIIVSDDLREYICPVCFASSSTKLSCNIYLDWSDVNDSGQNNGCFHTVESISAQAIKLGEPYEGPSTSNGEHRIVLRTNLTHHPDSNCIGAIMENDHGDLNKSLIKSIKLPSFPTALAASEMFPGLIIVGLVDDNIAFIGP